MNAAWLSLPHRGDQCDRRDGPRHAGGLALARFGRFRGRSLLAGMTRRRW